MTKFEQLINIKTKEEAVEFLVRFNGPEGLESTELCITCNKRKPGCRKPECSTMLIDKYLEREI